MVENKKKKKIYDAKAVEEKIRKFWQKEKIYKFYIKNKKQIYSIDTPPPTVSGNMHVGHAFSFAQQDFIARFYRMKQGVFYPFGTDDNGLPTERLVERLNNVKSKEMSRAEFIKLCLKTLNEISPEFIGDWKKLGISCDYGVFYSTIDKKTQKLSQKYFLDLYKKGRVYKKNFPTIWCPECQTAIAQAELEDKELESKFTTLKFKLANEKEIIPIATTRPELLPACIAVFVHPDDKRYRHFIGKKAKVPLFDIKVPIIADKSADIDKGTGVLMVCSYGDKYDVDAVQRHKLKDRVVFSHNGYLTIEPYAGLKIKDARKKILEDLKNNGVILEQKDISHVVNVHDKCGTEIEFLPTEQWFIKILDIKKKLISQGKKIRWHPKHMFKRYENWVSGLDWDWAISRDRHFGIPMPIWHCRECDEIITPREKELPVDPLQTNKKCPKCGQKASPEKKVLDTWATSSLTPQITSNLINNEIMVPYALRPQAHDIIRTWAFYTITRSFLHENKIPWKEIMISGFVTLKGEKMSKSKGNVVAPQDVMNKYGADALRSWAAGSKLGEDIDYQEKDVITGKRMITKLFNASKFVFTNLKNFNGKKSGKLEKIDELFLSKLNSVIGKLTKSFEEYEYSKAKQEIEKFFWNYFCDNYLEIVKWRVYNGSSSEKSSAFYGLYHSLLTILKLLAPIMPFITEEIYQQYYKKNEKVKSIHLCEWPIKLKEKNVRGLDVFFSILSKVRKAKSKSKKSVKAEIILSIEKKDKCKLKGMLEDLKHVVNAPQVKEGKFKVDFV